MQQFLFHSKFCNQTWKIYNAFLDFNYNLQQYSLFYSLFLYDRLRRFQMFRSTNKTSEQKKCSLDKTGEGNVVLDLTRSALSNLKLSRKKRKKQLSVFPVFS